MAVAQKEMEGWVTDHASDIATFYNALVQKGIPEEIAGSLAQELNHQSLRNRFRQ